ncbi:MAG: DUF423 domain-containing protein [Gammaproteobacteria bacterium]|nr:DUF423 domain-containing protein [Gammaproteobacteria bacterium]
MMLAGALLGASGVLLGAFGAHGLEGHLPANLLRAYQKAVDYQFTHALLLLFIGLRASQRPDPWLNRAGVFSLAGVLLFSGSLYLLALSGLRGIGWITPLGGISLVIGWLCLLKGLTSGHGARGLTS